MSIHHYDQTWPYAVWISKIRLLVLTIWAKSLFPSEPEVDFQWQQFSVITTIKPENIPFKFRKSVHKYPSYEPKTCFRRSFSIFLAKPEVDSKNERLGPYSALNSNYWRLNFENRSSSFRAMRERHTDIHTDRHTYIHTDRQMEPNYYIDVFSYSFH